MKPEKKKLQKKKGKGLEKTGRDAASSYTIKQAYGEAPSEAIGTLFKVMGIH